VAVSLKAVLVTRSSTSCPSVRDYMAPGNQANDAHVIVQAGFIDSIRWADLGEANFHPLLGPLKRLQ
jgi:hypothetical protein